MWRRPEVARHVDSGRLPVSRPARKALADGICDDTEVLCSYPEGTCACVQHSVAGPAAWECTGAPPACPAVRPKAGTACSTPMRCDYGGGCVGPPGWTMNCACGAWSVIPPIQCP